MELPPELVRSAASQAGLLARDQLVGAGVTPAAVRWNVGRHWQLVLPGVVALQRGTPSRHQRRVAALLHGGPDAILAGATSASLHGVTAADDHDLVRVLVPYPRTSRRTGFVDIRRTRLDDPDVVRRGALVMSCAARSVVDAAAAATTEDQARAIVIEAVQRRIAGIDGVRHWLGRIGRRGSARVRRAVDEAASGAWSVPEADLLELLTRSSVLPPAWANPKLRGGMGEILTTPDAWFDDVGLAVMVHSHAHHAIGEEWDETVERDGDLTAIGVVVVGVTPGRLARSPERVLDRIERAYQAASRRPRPPVRADRRYATA